MRKSFQELFRASGTTAIQHFFGYIPPWVYAGRAGRGDGCAPRSGAWRHALGGGAARVGGFSLLLPLSRIMNSLPDSSLPPTRHHPPPPPGPPSPGPLLVSQFSLLSSPTRLIPLQRAAEDSWTPPRACASDLEWVEVHCKPGHASPSCSGNIE